MKKRRKAQIYKNHDGTITVINIEGCKDIYYYYFDEGETMGNAEVEVIEPKEYNELLAQIGVDVVKAPFDLLQHVKDYILKRGIGGVRIAKTRNRVDGFCIANDLLKIVTPIEWGEY